MIKRKRVLTCNIYEACLQAGYKGRTMEEMKAVDLYRKGHIDEAIKATEKLCSDYCYDMDCSTFLISLYNKANRKNEAAMEVMRFTKTGRTNKEYFEMVNKLDINLLMN